MSKRVDLLEQVRSIVEGERRRDYDHPLPNHLRIGLLWSIRDGDYKNNDPVSVAHKLNLLKEGRDAFTPKWDNVADSAGYMLCISEMCDLYLKLKDEKKVKKNPSDMTKEEFEKYQLRVAERAYMALNSLTFCQMWDLLNLCANYDEKNLTAHS